MEAPANIQTSKFIKAAREIVYRAFTDPAALVEWLVPPDDGVQEFDLRVGGGYGMPLFYQSSDLAKRQDLRAGRPLYGTVHRTDAAIKNGSRDKLRLRRHRVRRRDDHGSHIARAGRRTEVTISFEHIAPGITRQGTRESLEKLARYLE